MGSWSASSDITLSTVNQDESSCCHIVQFAAIMCVDLPAARYDTQSSFVVVYVVWTQDRCKYMTWKPSRLLNNKVVWMTSDNAPHGS